MPRTDGPDEALMDPVIYKEIVVAHAGTNYVNGDVEFDLTTAEMDEMVVNFTAHPRQVPVLMGGEHAMGPDRADRPASGWVEGLKRVGNKLIARVKLIGDAAIAVASDTFRGVSIGAYQPPDLHGNPVGWRLDHLLVTNAPFFSDLNIAAQAVRHPGGLLYLTASKEAKMADTQEKSESKTTPDASIVEKHEALQIVLQEKEKVIRDLNASNENLREELAARQKNEDMEKLLTENRRKDRRIEAMRVRELVALGQSRGQFRRDEVQGYEGGDSRSDEITLAWFKNSIFEGDMKLLEFALKTRDKKVLGRAFHSGTPEQEGGEAYTAQEQDQIRAFGKDPAILAATREAKNFTDWKRAKTAAQKG
jgi:hypothetical protein